MTLYIFLKNKSENMSASRLKGVFRKMSCFLLVCVADVGDYQPSRDSVKHMRSQ